VTHVCMPFRQNSNKHAPPGQTIHTKLLHDGNGDEIWMSSVIDTQDGAGQTGTNRVHGQVGGDCRVRQSWSRISGQRSQLADSVKQVKNTTHHAASRTLRQPVGRHQRRAQRGQGRNQQLGTELCSATVAPCSCPRTRKRFPRRRSARTASA
jgi:hypothetical protein